MDSMTKFLGEEFVALNKKLGEFVSEIKNQFAETNKKIQDMSLSVNRIEMATCGREESKLAELVWKHNEETKEEYELSDVLLYYTVPKAIDKQGKEIKDTNK